MYPPLYTIIKLKTGLEISFFSKLKHFQVFVVKTSCYSVLDLLCYDKIGSNISLHIYAENMSLWVHSRNWLTWIWIQVIKLFVDIVLYSCLKKRIFTIYYIFVILWYVWWAINEISNEHEIYLNLSFDCLIPLLTWLRICWLFPAVG